MNNPGLLPENCLQKLKSFSDEIDKILLLFDDHGWVLSENKEIAQDLLSKLKTSFQIDVKSRELKRGDQVMTKAEKTFYYPAIKEAYTRINVKINSTPSEKWIMELLDAQKSIRYYIYDLENHLKNALQ